MFTIVQFLSVNCWVVSVCLEMELNKKKFRLHLENNLYDPEQNPESVSQTL